MRALAMVVFVAALVLFPATAEASIEEANGAYQEGDYAAAIAGYEALVRGGAEGADLYYNLGNAYFRAGKLGYAIYNYERALIASPGMEDAVYNIGVARRMVAARVGVRADNARSQSWTVQILTRLSTPQLFVLILILDGLVFGLLVALRFLATGPLRTALAVIAGFSGAALGLAALLVLGQLVFLREVDAAIVLPDTVAMREGADLSRAEKGELYAGVRVRIVERKDGWVKVRLANGGEGWLPVSAIGEL